MSSLKQLVFVSSAIQHPRHQKRIAALSQAFDVFVVYTTRSQYAKNIESFTHPEEKTCNLGHVQNRKYHLRIIYFFRLWLLLFRRPEKVVYCTSLEATIAALLARKKAILELGDLHQLGRFKKFYQWIDKVILKRIKMLVLTSPYFLTGYYEKINSKIAEKTVIVENKVTLAMKESIDNYRKREAAFQLDLAKIKLGLIGAIRYKNELEVIRKLLLERDDLELHIYGDGDTSVFEDLGNKCINHGVFRNPQDLESIYQNVDIVLILYSSTNASVRLALPNKLYESIGFGRPILCSDDTRLGELVTSNRYGLSCGSHNMSEQLNRIIDDYDSFRNNMLSRGEEHYLDSFHELNSRIEALFPPSSQEPSKIRS